MRETGLFTDFLWNLLFHTQLSIIFFADNNDALSSLNPEQQNLISCWNLLSVDDRALVKTYIAGLLKKLPE